MQIAVIAVSNPINLIDKYESLAGKLNKMDPFSILALDATEELLTYITDISDDRIGVFVGNVFAGWTYGEPQLNLLVENGPRAVHAYQATAWFPAAAQGEVTICGGWKGIAKSFSGSRCSFGEALLSASMNIFQGRIDVALVGMSEATTSSFLCKSIDLDPLSQGGSSCFILIANRKMLSGLNISVDLLSGILDKNYSEIGWSKELHQNFSELLKFKKNIINLPLNNNYFLSLQREI